MRKTMCVSWVFTNSSTQSPCKLQSPDLNLTCPLWGHLIDVTSSLCSNLLCSRPYFSHSWKDPSFFYLFSTKCQGQTWQLASTPYLQLRHILWSTRYHLSTSVTSTTSSFWSKPPSPVPYLEFCNGLLFTFYLTVENVNNKIYHSTVKTSLCGGAGMHKPYGTCGNQITGNPKYWSLPSTLFEVGALVVGEVLLATSSI